MTRICFGCGATLQYDDKDKIGYVPEEKYNDSKYCMRCFRMMHYGELSNNDVPKDAKEIIRKVNKDNIFVIFLCDYLNINNYVMDLFKSITGKKLLVINKGELLPDNITYDMLKRYVQDIYDIDSDIKVKGGTANHGIKSIYNYLMDNNIHESYLLGISNSGKSTFINDMADILDSNVAKINTNRHENTTIDFMRVKLDNSLMLIDSPGFVIPNSLSNEVFDKDIKMLSYDMKDDEVISLLNNKYFIKFNKGTPITLYTNIDNNNLITKYYKEIDVNNELDIEDNMDIIIYGIGIIRCKYNTNIITNIPVESIELRKSIFGGNYE